MQPRAIRMLNLVGPLTCTTLLAACATLDLANDATVPAEERALASRIAARAVEACIRGRYANSSATTMVNRQALRSAPKIQRMFQGGAGGQWIRADALADGVEARLYYNVRNQNLFCGEDSWNAWIPSSGIRFEPWGSTARTYKPY